MWKIQDNYHCEPEAVQTSVLTAQSAIAIIPVKHFLTIPVKYPVFLLFLFSH